MDLYAINMMSGTSIASHISLLHTSMIAHMQDPLSEFHSVTTCAHRLLRSLPMVLPWVEFRIKYHNFMVIGAPSGMDLGFRLMGHRIPSPQSCSRGRSLSRGASPLRPCITSFLYSTYLPTSLTSTHPSPTIVTTPYIGRSSVAHQSRLWSWGAIRGCFRGFREHLVHRGPTCPTWADQD